MLMVMGYLGVCTHEGEGSSLGKSVQENHLSFAIGTHNVAVYLLYTHWYTQKTECYDIV